MTQEDKDLLMQDLCSRLPYNVIVSLDSNRGVLEAAYPRDYAVCVDELEHKIHYDYGASVNYGRFDIEESNVRPYLRRMSSITEDEAKFMLYELVNDRDSTKPEAEECALHALWNAQLNEWLNAHHFDYRGLIDKGLAIEVTEENNPYENE